jgi:hypothetical protein
MYSAAFPPKYPMAAPVAATPTPCIIDFAVAIRKQCQINLNPRIPPFLKEINKTNTTAFKRWTLLNLFMLYFSYDTVRK